MKSWVRAKLSIFVFAGLALLTAGLLLVLSPGVSAQSSEADCRAAGGAWQRGADNTYQCVGGSGPCSESNPAGCKVRDECTSNGGVWLSEERQHCVPMNETNCVASGGTWVRLSGCSGGGSTQPNPPGTTVGGPASQCSQSKKKSVNFFRMPTWYQYLDYDPQTCDVKFCVLGNGDNGCDKSSIPLVLLAFIDIALRIGALVAVGFVVYGGIKFVTSQGEPDEVKSARNTILNALIGLVIAMIATPMVVFLGTRLGV